MDTVFLQPGCDQQRALQVFFADGMCQLKQCFLPGTPDHGVEII